MNPLHLLFLQYFKFYWIKPHSISDDVTSSSDEGGEGKISKKGKKAKEAERVKKRLEEIASVTFFCSIFNRESFPTTGNLRKGDKLWSYKGGNQN